MQSAIDWMTSMKDKQSLCADTTGDRHTIQNKLDRLHVSNVSTIEMLLVRFPFSLRRSLVIIVGSFHSVIFSAPLFVYYERLEITL